MLAMSHSETCGICHTNGCVHIMADIYEQVPLTIEPPLTPGVARACPLDVTEDPDLFDYSNEGDALVIEEVRNVKR